MSRIQTSAKYVRSMTVIAIAIFFLGGALFTATWFGASPVKAETTTQMIPATFAEVASKASPAVVNISTIKTTKGGDFHQFNPFGNDKRMKEFFERFFGDQMPQRERKERSLGTGFIIDPSGLLITNNHVVEGADDIMVKMSNGKEFKAKVLGRDPKTDLALLKIDDSGSLPSLTLGDPDKIRVGDWVVAIGNPFGLEHTVTSGILSARGRVIGAGPYDDFLQTDASINPGNSGGPLLNLQGQVIGINTAIVAHGSGIGFAIPADLAKNIVDQLRDKGKVVRGWLGVMIQGITPELAKSFKLNSDKGALVADVSPGGPAEDAGFKRGDVIVRFDGHEVEKSSDLPAIVAATPVGKEVKVDVIRNGDKKSIEVKIGELKEEGATAEASGEKDLGLTVQELTPDLARKLGLSETKGVVITSVTGGSIASEAGLKPGDLIVEINRGEIEGMADYRKVMEKVKKGDNILFLIRRGDSTIFFTLEAE